MGWFSDLVSSATDFVSAATDFVSEKVVKPAVRAAKTAAAKAIHFMAEKAEKIVGRVKEVWKRVKPYVQKAPALLRAAAPHAAKIPYVGAYVGAAATLAATCLAGLLALENSPVLKKIEKAISTAAQKARDLQQQILDGQIEWLTPEEYKAATRARKDFREAEKEAAELSAKQRKALELAAAINDFGIARTDLKNVIEGEPSDYEHYLRLRAAQKLLGIAEKKLTEAGSMDAVTEDDWFVVRIASDLIKSDPEMKASAAERLNALLRDGYTGRSKTLQSFVYEELIAAWGKQASDLKEEVGKEAREMGKVTADLKRLQIAKRVQMELDAAENAKLAILEQEVPQREQELEVLATRQRDVEWYANAAEGFLQMLEKSPEALEEDGREFVLDEGERLGRIIVDAAQNDTPFGSLDEEDQALVTTFANIFREEAKERMRTVLEMAA